MLLTITTTQAPATDLGYLLGKHPGRAQSFELSFGRAHVFFPEAAERRCTAALLLDVDPVALVRTGREDDAFALAEYTNDRPYVASSLLCVALSRVFGAALGGRSRERQELADAPIPLEARLPAVPARGAERLVRALFEPLGYEVEITRHPLAADLPAWGASPYHDLTLRAVTRLGDLLRHLTVLIPVLDDDKHYWVGSDEVDKLLDRGEGWLEGHPLRDLIVQRYLRHQRSLAREALTRLSDGDPPPAAADDEGRSGEARLEAPLSLDELRREAVLAALHRLGARAVADLGCGEGKLLRALVHDRAFTRVLGMDVAPVALERAARRLRLDEADEREAARVTLFQGSLTYRDARLRGLDAACAVEVVEHLEPSRLGAFEDALFAHARPRHVLVTTPNREHNLRFPALAAGALRHPDHRFEWTRDEFAAWARGVASRHGYQVELAGIGHDDPELGPPTQIAIFSKG